jgi:hypothetical protein
MVRAVLSTSPSARVITPNLIPASLWPQTRDLLFGDTSQRGGRGVFGGRIVGVEM